MTGYDSWKTTEPDREPAPGEHRPYDDACDCNECERNRRCDCGHRLDDHRTHGAECERLHCDCARFVDVDAEWPDVYVPLACGVVE